MAAAAAAAGAGVAPFLAKTYALVDDPSTDEMISWNEDGSGFVVWRPAEFARDLLPKHFKHSNFSSFVRQLNTYGFRKTIPDRWEFANDCFRRGEKRLLGGIHRRKVSPPVHNVIPTAIPIISSPPSSGGEPAVSSGSSPPRAAVSSAAVSSAAPAPAVPVSGAVAELEEENERLRRENARLARELTRARRLCDGVLRLVSQYNSDAGDDEATPQPPPPEAEEEVEPSGSGRARPMLFGFPLGAKRSRDEEEGEQEEEQEVEENDDEDDDRHVARRKAKMTKSEPLDPAVLVLSMRAAAAARRVRDARDRKNSVT